MLTRRAHFASWSGLRTFVSLPQFVPGVKTVKVSLFSQSLLPGLEWSQDKGLRKDSSPNQEVKPSSADGT
jgi:hypothetical protein